MNYELKSLAFIAPLLGRGWGRFLLSVIVLAACAGNGREPSLSNILCGGDIRYWEYVDDDYRFPIYFLFDSNGRWLPLEQDEQGNIKKYVLSDCLTYHEKWSLQDDSLLYLGWNNKGYAIKSYCDSCILLKQGGKLFKLRSIDDFQDAVKKNAKHYQENLDSIMNMYYEIIVDSTIKQGNNYLVLGTNLYGEKKTIIFTQEEICTIAPHHKDSLIKRKNWVLINKVTEDSVYLYNYFITSRNCFLWNSAGGLKTSFKPNIDGVLVNTSPQIPLPDPLQRRGSSLIH